MHVAFITSQCIADYMYNLRGVETGSDEYFEIRKQIHTRCAKRIYKVSVKNRGIYYKAGQYLGNLERIMPKEYTEILKVL